jgi:hypothetical protein
MQQLYLPDGCGRHLAAARTPSSPGFPGLCAPQFKNRSCALGSLSLPSHLYFTAIVTISTFYCDLLCYVQHPVLIVICYICLDVIFAIEDNASPCTERTCLFYSSTFPLLLLLI